MLALDDLLGLLGDPVQLNVFRSFLEVFDFKVKPLLLIADLLERHLKVRDVVHESDLHISLSDNFLVFIIDYVLRNQDGILVVRSDWKLRHFNLSLLQINDNFKIVSDFLDPIECLLLSSILSLEVVINFSEVILEMVDVLL